MKAITSVGATPHRVRLLYDFMKGVGTAGESRERLASLFAPPTLSTKSEPGDNNAFADSLNAGEEMGLFRIEAGVVRLGDGVAAVTFLDAADQRLVVEAESADQPSGWCAAAVAWMLTADPTDPLPWSDSSAMTRLRTQTNPEGAWGMTNNSRFQQAVYWARFLGYAARSTFGADVVIPDPTPAISRRIQALLPEGEERPLPLFLADLGRACPVLDGGHIRLEVEGACGVERRPSTPSRSMALALGRLRQRGVLAFRDLADGTSVFADGLPEGRATHVTRVSR